MALTCEICGRPIRGQAYKILVAGAVLTVCESCRRYGTPLPSRPPQPHRVMPVRRARPVRRVERGLFGEELRVVDDFNIVVRRARESLGWTQDFLASQVGEKVSVIRRIEAGSLTPSIELARRLEKALGVRLLERVEEEERPKLSTGDFALTLGDVIRVKRRERGRR